MNKKFKLKIKNITPAGYLCLPVGACPSVYQFETKKGIKLAIVGKRGKASKLGIAGKVGKDEDVVIVDREMLRQIFEK